MRNFVRSLRLALRHRWTLVGSIASALLVAVLWGGNISAVYPFVEVVFKGQSMQEWATGEVESTERKIANLRNQVERCDELLHLADGDLTARIGQERDCAELELQTAIAVPADTAMLRRAVQELRRKTADLASLASLPSSVQRARLESDRNQVAHRLATEERAADWYRWIRPHIQQHLPNDPFHTLVWVLGLLFVGTLLKCGFMIANSMLGCRLALLATFDLRKEFYRRTMRMDLASFSNDGIGELMSRFTYDMENVNEGIAALFGKAIREPLKMIACLIGAAFVCWRLLLLSLLVAPLAVYVINRLSRLLKGANRRAMEEMSQIYGILEQTLQGIKVVKAFTMERAERRRFHQNNKQFFNKSMRIVRYESLGRPTIELMGILTICLALLAGAYIVLKGETHLLGIKICDRPLSLGALLVFYGMLAGMSDPARKLAEIFNRLQRAAAASDRIYAMLDRETAVREPRKPQPLPRHKKSILFEHVHFRYRPSIPVLEDVHLEVPFGETVAIVGPNGCGKSTLVNLLPRFFDPVQGRILVDGVNLRNVRLRDIRSQIGLVTQETLLFDDTVYNNIRYGSPWATADQVKAAAERAKAHRFIEERLADGYQTIVGPHGSLLSGGQRQRIALARAILRDPSILILDEATSQIDLESEQLIHKALEQFTVNRTTLIVTHRLSTLVLADRIAVMNAGRILDLGTHDQLLRRCDFYARLHDIQLGQVG